MHICGPHMGQPPSQDGVGTDSLVRPGRQHTWPGYHLKNAPPPADRLTSHFVAHHVRFVVRTCERQQQSHPQSAMACEDKAAMASTELLHAIPGHTSKLALRRGRSGRSCGARGRALTCQSPHSCVRTQYENCLTIKSTKLARSRPHSLRTHEEGHREEVLESVVAVLGLHGVAPAPRPCGCR